jgi:hypothetical protein
MTRTKLCGIKMSGILLVAFAGVSFAVEGQDRDRWPGAPYPPSELIRAVEWSPADAVIRQADGSDNWPITWADDDHLYTAYGDGWGFVPKLDKKLSLGFAKVAGGFARWMR